MDFFVAVSTEHTPVTISISKNKNPINSHGFWKFSSFLLSDQNCVWKIKNLIQTIQSTENFIPNAQLKRELLKYEIQKWPLNIKKKLVKQWKENRTLL